MFANHPEMAKRWADHTPDIKKLPEHAEKSGAITMQELAVKTAAADPALSNALGLGGAGALLGAGIGGISGLFSPDDDDDDADIMSRIGSGLGGAVRGGIYGGVGGAALGGLGTEAMRALPSMQFATNRQARGDKATHPQTFFEPATNWLADKLDAGKEFLYNNKSRLGQHESVRADLNTRQSPLRHVYDNPFSRQGGTYLDALSKQFGVK
jgi:hypothetical protein